VKARHAGDFDNYNQSNENIAQSEIYQNRRGWWQVADYYKAKYAQTADTVEVWKDYVDLKAEHKEILVR